MERKAAMIYRTGYSLKSTGSERYIQIETILAFYEQKFMNTGKHLLFEDENYIGDITSFNNEWVCTGLTNFSEVEKDEILTFLKQYKSPEQESRSSEFGFGIEREDNITYCEVILKNHLYDIWFDGSKAGRITQDKQWKWVQLLGTAIPASVLKEISQRIEDHYS